MANTASAETEWETRVSLAAAYRYAEVNGWADLIFNHLTARVPGEPQHILVKPHHLFFDEVTASSLLKVDIEGKPVGQEEGINPAAFTIHTAVFQNREDVNSVMHLHTRAGAALSALKGGLRFLTQESMMFYDRIGYHDSEGVAVDLGERERIARDLGPHRALILRNHGLLACGRSIQEAALTMRDLILAAQSQIDILATGAETVEAPPEACERTARIFERGYERDSWLPQWHGVLRMLDRRDPSYRT